MSDICNRRIKQQNQLSGQNSRAYVKGCHFNSLLSLNKILKITAVDAIHWLYWYHNIQYWPNKTRRRDTSLIPAPAHWISPDVVRDFWHKGFSTFEELTTKWCPLNQCPADGTENTRSSRDFVKILFPFTPIGQLNFSSGRCTNRASMYSQFPAPYIYD